jgi:hypothetical protein
MFPPCATVFALVNVRSLFIYGTLLFVLANGAYAGGAYQRTKDGKTRVWNNNPQPGDMATWSGDRDKEKYATGYGTLTWYTTQRKDVTGSNLPAAKYTLLSHYSGIMVRGKLDGVVENVDADGKIFHGTFIDGRKGNDWTAGPASGPASAAIAFDPQHPEPISQTTAGEAPPNEPAPPAAGPGSSPVSVPPPSQSYETTKQSTQSVSTPMVTERPSPTIDDSLQSLIGPASSPSAKTEVVAEVAPQPSVAPATPSPPPVTSTSPSPPPAGSRLNAAEVIELANAQARKEGCNPREYLRPQADYNAADETWSVSYDQKYANGFGNHFSVSVEDKTKKTSFTAGR